MPDFDVQVIIKGISGLPRDRFINTLHFSQSGVAPWQPLADTIGAELIAVWQGFAAEATNWAIYTADVCQRAFEVRIYNPDDSEPRPPHIYTGNLPASPSQSLPTEVALCLSYRTDQNVPRKRGRIYLGPLGTVVNGTAQRPTAAAQAKLLALGQSLSDIGDVQMDWQLMSRSRNARERIEYLWVDNEFDTQRRRGIRATARVTASTSG